MEVCYTHVCAMWLNTAAPLPNNDWDKCDLFYMNIHIQLLWMVWARESFMQYSLICTIPQPAKGTCMARFFGPKALSETGEMHNIYPLLSFLILSQIHVKIFSL